MPSLQSSPKKGNLDSLLLTQMNTRMESTNEKYGTCINVFIKFCNENEFDYETISNRTPVIIAGFLEYVSFVRANKVLKDTSCVSYINAIKMFIEISYFAIGIWLWNHLCT
eukprot:NODE_37_length_35953_cov_1.028037.p16 type:complete len:111 gc:universal NODE_37_length_35953_cov_1.028037:16140-16472(+)